MTKKQMEERIAQLEKTVAELQSQLLALALRPYTVTIPAPITIPKPMYPLVPVPAWPTTPYIGDPPYGTGPTITCGNVSSATRKDLQ